MTNSINHVEKDENLLFYFHIRYKIKYLNAYKLHKLVKFCIIIQILLHVSTI